MLKPPVVVLAAPNDGHTATYVRRALEVRGCEVRGFDYRQMAAMASLAGMNETLTWTTKGADLLLILKGEYIHPKALEIVRRQGVKIAIWNFDPRDGKQDWVLERARVADYFFTIAKGLVPYYVKEGIMAHWMLEGCDPFNHQPLTPTDATVAVSFIGTVSDVAGREQWLKQVRDYFGAVNFQVWGSFCPTSLKDVHHGRAEGDAGFSRVVSNTMVNLGWDRNPEIERSYGARLFRTLAAGGYLLTNETVGIHEDFSGALATYRDTADCLRKITWALEHPQESRRIGERGRELVLRQHTFANRIQSILRITGVEQDG